MSYDYSRLRGKIVEKFKSQRRFALAMGMSERTLSLKLSNKHYWKQPEILKAIELLGIPQEEITLYFFNTIVQYN